jgi:hypothetical protein
VGADQRTPRSEPHQRPTTKQRRGYPSLLEELAALQDALDASEERSNILAYMLFDLLKAVPAETLEKLPDDFFARSIPSCRNRCRMPCESAALACEYCGKPMSGERLRRYCSAAHRQAAYRERQR